MASGVRAAWQNDMAHGGYPPYRHSYGVGGDVLAASYTPQQQQMAYPPSNEGYNLWPYDRQPQQQQQQRQQQGYCAYGACYPTLPHRKQHAARATHAHDDEKQHNGAERMDAMVHPTSAVYSPSEHVGEEQEESAGMLDDEEEEEEENEPLLNLDTSSSVLAGEEEEEHDDDDDDDDEDDDDDNDDDDDDYDDDDEEKEEEEEQDVDEKEERNMMWEEEEGNTMWEEEAQGY